MKPYNNFKTFVFTLTTAFIFLCWIWLYPYINTNPILGMFFGGLISLGSYRLILKTTEYLFINIKCIKKITLGNIFLEGIWVGSYIGLEKQPIFFIENFEQTLEGLIIRGRCFYEDNKYKGSWVSDTVIIDEIKGSISYTYETDMINNVHKNQGLAVFSFDRTKKNKAPIRLYGYSSDIFMTQKNISIEKKIENPKIKEENELLKEAHKVYDDNKKYFGNIS